MMQLLRSADSSRSLWVELLTLWLQRRTWRSALYLMVGLPLGIVYFAFVVTAISVSGGLLVTVAGIPLLILTFVVVRYLIQLDAEIAGVLTGTDIELAPSPWSRDGSVLEKIKRTLTDRGTWRGYAYLLAMLPIGAINFTITVLFTAGGVYGATAWIWSRWDYIDVGMDLFYIRDISWRFESPISVPWQFETLIVVAGVLLIIVTPAVLVFLAHGQAQFARFMLADSNAPVASHVEPFDSTLQQELERERSSRNRALERKLFLEHTSLYIVVNTFLAIIDLVNGGDTWFYWSLIGWGTLLAVHAATVYLPFFGEGWYERKTRELLHIRDE